MSDNIVGVIITINGEKPGPNNPAYLMMQTYTKLLAAQATDKDTDTTTSKKTYATRIETIMSQTIFRGMLVPGTSSGVGGADWNVNSQGMMSLLTHIAGPSVIQGEEFNDYWVNILKQPSLGDSSVGVEGKIMQQEKKTKSGDQAAQEIKIASLSVLDIQDGSRIKYFDHASSTPIDVSKHSVIGELRQSYLSNPRDYSTSFQVPDHDSSSRKKKMAPAKFTSLDNGVNTSKLAAFIRGLNKDFQAFVKTDDNYIALEKMLKKYETNVLNAKESGAEVNPLDSTKVAVLVKQLNERWYVSSFKTELQNLSTNGKLFDYIKNTPKVGDQFYYKSRLLSIIRRDTVDSNKARVLLLSFPRSKFTSDFFGARLDGDSIKVFIKSDIEKIFLKELGEATALSFDGDLKAFDDAVSNLVNKNERKTFNYLTHTIEYLIPTGKSIPMSRAKLNYKSFKQPRDTSHFISNKANQEVPTKFIPQSNYNIGTFLSTEYIRLEVIKRIVAKMPEGPVGGRPLSNRVLTYRTGEFANSLTLMINYRTSLVTYYYNPIYFVHEKTSRNPRDIITNSIREVMSTKFKQAFNISKKVI